MLWLKYARMARPWVYWSKRNGVLTKKLFIYIVLLMISSPLFALQEVNQSSMQAYAERYLKLHRRDEHVSAIAITLKQGREQPVTVTAGYTGHDKKTPVTEDSLFHVGSITKSFISAIILQLDGEASYHFSIDDKLETFFPEYVKWQGVTIRQLMNMTSGIPDYLSSQHFINDMIANPYRYRSPQELIQYAYEENPKFSPGMGYNYSNTNYILLGLIIEKVTGHALADELKSRILQKLGLHHTFYSIDKFNKTQARTQVHGYTYRKINRDFVAMGADTTDFSLSFYGASGGMVSTTADIAQWIESLFVPEKILTGKQLQKMKTIVSTRNGKEIALPTHDNPDGFGLGIVYSYFPDINEFAYAYEGITLSGRALYLYVPAHNMILSVAVNSSVDGSRDNPDHLKELVLELYRHVYPAWNYHHDN